MEQDKFKKRFFEMMNRVNKINLNEDFESEKPELGIEDLEKAEKAREINGDQLEGGLGDDADPKDYDIDQLLAGLNVELEHTDDPEIALEIALDHLKENDRYYDYLDKMESSWENKSDEDVVVDEILGFKPHNVSDYAESVEEKKVFNENFDFNRAELEAQEKYPNEVENLKRFEYLYGNWKRLDSQEKQEAIDLHTHLNKAIKLFNFDMQC